MPFSKLLHTANLIKANVSQVIVGKDYLYRHWIFDFMRKGYMFKRSLTPAETLMDLGLDENEAEQSGRQLTDLYERVRYGGDTASISDEETDLMREAIGKTN
jgi:hypothetical protein